MSELDSQTDSVDSSHNPEQPSILAELVPSSVRLPGNLESNLIQLRDISQALITSSRDHLIPDAFGDKDGEDLTSLLMQFNDISSQIQTKDRTIRDVSARLVKLQDSRLTKWGKFFRGGRAGDVELGLEKELSQAYQSKTDLVHSFQNIADECIAPVQSDISYLQSQWDVFDALDRDKLDTAQILLRTRSLLDMTKGAFPRIAAHMQRLRVIRDHLGDTDYSRDTKRGINTLLTEIQTQQDTLRVKQEELAQQYVQQFGSVIDRGTEVATDSLAIIRDTHGEELLSPLVCVPDLDQVKLAVQSRSNLIKLLNQNYDLYFQYAQVKNSHLAKIDVERLIPQFDKAFEGRLKYYLQLLIDLHSGVLIHQCPIDALEKNSNRFRPGFRQGCSQTPESTSV
jgi:hypothetical protein